MGVGDVRYGGSPKESTLEVVPGLDELRDKVPAELFDMVARASRQPSVEELDI
jgi:EXLDI family protein